MKKIIIVAFVALNIVSCGGEKKIDSKKENTTIDKKVETKGIGGGKTKGIYTENSIDSTFSENTKPSVEIAEPVTSTIESQVILVEQGIPQKK